METFVKITALLLLAMPRARCSGYVEILLSDYYNPGGILADGTCCGSSGNVTSVCPGECETSITICLQPYRSESNRFGVLDSNSCLYGSQSLDGVIIGNSFRGDNRSATRINFQFDWPGSTTLIFELNHVLKKSASDNALKHRLIHRSVEAMTVDSGSPDWLSVESHGASSRSTPVLLRYRVRVGCDPFYHGPACNVHCKPSHAGDDDKKGHYTCTEGGVRNCTSGWTGPTCNQPICSPACTHGRCTAPNVCKCDYGWRGNGCDDCVPYEGCVHGFCSKPFECLCHERWGGLQCDIDMDYCMHHRPCFNGAICDPHAPNNYTCNCKLGFTGRNCEIKVSSCQLNPCRNGGTCALTGTADGFGYKCLCNDLHQGTHCDFVVPSKTKDSSQVTTPDIEQPSAHSNEVCFYQGRVYQYGSRWDTMDCRQCNCIQGVVNCTAAVCMSENCLSNENNQLNQRCPANQVCESLTSAVCLRAPCHVPYGRCVPWYVLAEDSRSRQPRPCQRRMDAGDYNGDDRCARFYARLDRRRLPQGATVERVCYHLLLVLLTRHLDQFTTDCSLAPGTVNGGTDLVVQVDMISLRNWPVTGLKGIVMDVLRQNLTASPVLRAVTTILEAHGSAEDITSPEHTKPTDKVTWSFVIALVLIPVSLCFLVAVCIGLIALMLKRVYHNTSMENSESSNRNNLYNETEKQDNASNTLRQSRLLSVSLRNVYASELEPEDKFSPRIDSTAPHHASSGRQHAGGLTRPPPGVGGAGGRPGKVCNLMWPAVQVARPRSPANEYGFGKNVVPGEEVNGGYGAAWPTYTLPVPKGGDRYYQNDDDEDEHMYASADFGPTVVAQREATV